MLAKIETGISCGLKGLDGRPMNVTTPRDWAALIARPNREQDAADWLKRFQFFAYWPCYQKDENAGGKRRNGFGLRRVRYSSLIPGMIFVATHQGSRVNPWALVGAIPGIISYMHDGAGHPAWLGEEDILTIRRIEGGENKPQDRKTAHKFKIKEKVRFCDDLLGRWPPGTIERLADDGRISIGVPVLGRIVSILAFPHQIEAM